MTMATADVIAAALAAHPELQRLLDLDGTGWMWMPPPVDDEGTPLEVHGVRVWTGEPPDVDGLRIRSATDAAAVRTDWEGGVLWRREGGLVEVIDALLELPPPASPYAPRLVIGSAPRDLWLP